MAKITIYLRWANIFLILITFVSYLSPFINPNDFWLPLFFGIIYPWLLLLHLIFIAFWVGSKKYYFFLSLGCVLLGWSHFVSFVGLNFNQSLPTEEKNVIRVMSFNGHQLTTRDGQRKVVDKEQFLKFLQQYSPDILCVQEFIREPYTSKKYISFITQKSGLSHYYKDKAGSLAVFSKFPISNLQTIHFTNRSNGYQIIDLNIGANKWRMFNIHLQSNAVTGLADKVAKEKNFQDKETWLNIKGMMGRYRHNAKRRANQAQEIRRHILKSPYPVLIMGDLNDTPLSFTYQVLSEGLKDTFKERGRGLGVTYAGNIPGLRIDYIMVDPKISVHKIRTGKKVSFSDHFPVVCELEFPD